MCNIKAHIHPRCGHSCSISPTTTVPCIACYSDPIHCDILTTKETIPYTDLPSCDQCYAHKKQAIDNVKAFFRNVDKDIVEQAGLEFPKEDIKRMRRTNIQIRRSELGWLGRVREEVVWDK